ncbi:hypothetical protein GOZ97_25245 [Agrobacterium vitis]|uniref:FGGY family carbohydrate kinase n=1 Tax=Agrobacterium vitis TaxID=373 RepID=UPI0009BF774E|nr:FGGY family carbohydrate kinase [Agrobacterium vitis]MCF1436684.1 hypothetical protein [Allorhizobium ampelinum]MUO92249.1 hypothetical protein [Agrobacterium vitis]MUZ55442.1 hypothetical protein [Agrobacterium vitis]MUZ94707.1 hypothetical protein [Agrobacterium vitis]MVA43044.1 hypothetical protein [Agrobacterium vitis]
MLLEIGGLRYHRPAAGGDLACDRGTVGEFSHAQRDVDDRDDAPCHCRADHGEFIFQKGNNWPTTTWTLPHLAWIKRHDNDSWTKMRHFLLSKDHIVYRLTGRLTSDPAAAVSALLYDVHEEKWSPEICSLIGLPLEVLPEVLPIGAKIGTVGAEGAEILGLSQDTIC